MQEEEKLTALSNRYRRLAIISLFVMAFLQGLDAIFFTIFFWLAVGFGALALNYYIAAKREEKPNVQWDRTETGAAPILQDKKRLFIIVFSLAIGFMIFFSMVVSIFSSGSDDTDAQAQEQTTETGTEQVTEQLTDYQLATKESDNQNYRQSISIGRKALISKPNDLDLLLLVGDDYGQLKQYDSSFLYFDKAYQLGARSAYLSHWMGYFYDEKGQTSRAIEFYKDALRQDSTRTQVYDRLAELEPGTADWYKRKSQQWSAK